ncbi:MAG: hypothetical protein ACMVO3_07060 [Thalassobaculum sp.]
MTTVDQNGTAGSDLEQFDVEPVNRRDRQQPLYAPRQEDPPEARGRASSAASSGW